MDLARMNAERGLNGPLRILDKQRRRCVTPRGFIAAWVRPAAGQGLWLRAAGRRARISG
jgi:hypothetical protein